MEDGEHGRKVRWSVSKGSLAKIRSAATELRAIIRCSCYPASLPLVVLLQDLRLGAGPSGSAPPLHGLGNLTTVGRRDANYSQHA